MKHSVGIAATALALCTAFSGPVAASAPDTAARGAVAVSFFDVNLAGWQSFGEFGDALNNRVTIDIGAGSQVIGFEWINLSFTAQSYPNGETSWLQDLTLSVNNSTGTQFLDWSPSTIADGGSFGPASGAWGGEGLPGNGGAGGPFTAVNGQIVVTIYDAVDDPIGDNGAQLDTLITAGTLRVLVTPIPEPGTYAMMALGLAGLGVVLRRRQTAR